MRRKFGIWMLCAVLLSAVLSGCGRKSSEAIDSTASAYSTYDGAGTRAAGSMSDIAEEEIAEVDTSIVDEARENVKRIYSGNLQLESVDFDGSMKKIQTLVEDSGGYFQENEIYSRDSSWGSSRSFREAYMRARIPAARFEDVVEALSEGDGFTVTRRSISSEDVSEQYYDIETRLEAARSEVERLTDLMDQAKDVSDVIAVEEALSDATYKLERLQGQINGLDSRIEYSVLSINLTEVTALTMTATAAGYGSKLLESLSSGFTSGVEFLGELLLAIAGNWLILVLLLCVLLLVIRFGKKCVKSTRQRKEARKKEKNREEGTDKEKDKEKDKEQGRE